MNKIINHFLVFLVLFVSACSSVPKNTSNSCSIFNERYLWYKYAKKTEEKWGTPIYVQLAIIKMESDFDWLAKPPRQKLFKVIPVSYTHLRAHETDSYLVCRLLLEKKQTHV